MKNLFLLLTFCLMFSFVQGQSFTFFKWGRIEITQDGDIIEKNIMSDVGTIKIAVNDQGRGTVEINFTTRDLDVFVKTTEGYKMGSQLFLDGYDANSGQDAFINLRPDEKSLIMVVGNDSSIIFYYY